MDETRAVVFDLDGTLVDSAADLCAALNRLLKAEGRRLLELEEATAMIGDGARVLVHRAFAASGPAAAETDLGELTRRFLAHYAGHAVDLTRPLPGVVETLERLRRSGMRLGVCTNKPFAATTEILDGLDLARFFGAVRGGDSLEGVRKPDPRSLLAVLERLGVPPARAIMVGDNRNDVEAARRAGLPVILLAGGYTATPAEQLGADAVILSFADLPAALASLWPERPERP